MPKTIFSGEHRHLVDVLVRARKAVGLTQAELGRRIGKNQKFISLIEQSQRRVDVIEFFALAKALRVPPSKLFRQVAIRLPSTIEI